MSQSDSVHVLRNKTSLPGLNARPNEGASPVPPRPYQIRGRSSTTSSASFTTAFPIGAGPRNTTTSVASTSSTGRRPLPSPPKITIATASGSSDTRDAISPLASSGNLSPPSALATRPAPSPKPRARTQSGSRTPVPARQTLPARTAPTSIGAGYDVANNTLVIRPLKSSERNVPAPLTLRSADRPFNRTTPPNSASDRRAVTSPERIPPSTVNQMSPSPPTRSPQTASTAPPFLARKPAHSRTNSANNPTTTTLFSSPTSAGLRLNTTIVSPSSFPRPKGKSGFLASMRSHFVVQYHLHHPYPMYAPHRPSLAPFLSSRFRVNLRILSRARSHLVLILRGQLRLPR
ncbi:hypothetical protein DL96DRAFT_102411 [Flagelloscypha sp. PMI_526]|nr:hypothetical protein DL96DRAFT_102411 [Flagelloscypha sp. PMI_526]